MKRRLILITEQKFWKKPFPSCGRANNSFQPTLASEPLMLKLCGFGYLVAVALASGGLIRALGAYLLVRIGLH